MTPPEERREQAARLFHQAWALLDDLTALRRRLPEPNMPAASRLPSEWNEFRSLSVCVDTLRGGLNVALKNVVTGLGVRNEWQLRDALLPPSAKLPHDAQSYLDWLEERMRGGSEPEDQP